MTLNDANWTDNLDGTATLTSPIASLAAGSSTTVNITLTVDANFQGSSLTNNAEISSADDDTDDTNTPPTDVDSTPNTDPTDDTVGGDNVIDGTNGDEDDHDPATVNVGQVFDLALIKTTTATTVSAGDDVLFTLEVFNQGTLDAYNITLTDYIPSGMSLNDAAWTDNLDGTATLTSPIASLAAGTSTTVDITLTVDASFQGTSLTNNAEISSADDDTDDTNTPPTDVDSTPNTDPTDDVMGADNVVDGTNGDEDDHDPATVNVGQTFDLALIKTTTATTVSAGDDVLFTLEVFNQGTLDAYNITLTDYIPTGMTLNDAAWTDNLDGTATLDLTDCEFSSRSKHNRRYYIDGRCKFPRYELNEQCRDQQCGQ